MSPDTTMALMQAGQQVADKAGFAVKQSAVGKNGANDPKAVESAAQDFEAVMIAEMLKPMLETVEVDSMFGGGKGEEIFRGMMVQEYGKMIAKTGGIGIADHVKAELIRQQGQSALNSLPMPANAIENLQKDMTDGIE
ncbi:MAG: flagellar biosynthesis protein FlgJ [Alphaproteobacteria bacterium]|nr:flagellar biosynthesis protein FlgJ [Alphaproteobacteria bacterium]